MTEIHATSPASAPSPHQLPRHTTPTWEVELLISGVAVFAMLQLPGLLDDWLFALVPRFGDDWRAPLVMAYIYAKGFALVLAATFSLHLLLRARWIALVGTHSVYPAGIDWQRLRMGPIQRAVERARYGDAASAIERADNLSTVVFAFGVMLASMLLVILLALTGLFALVMLVIVALGLDADPSNAFGVCTVLAMLPWILGHQVDRRFGERLSEHSRLRRLLAAVFRFFAPGMGRSANPVLSLVASHGGERRALLLTMVLMLIALGSVGLGYAAMYDPQSFGGYAGFPSFDDGRRTVDSAHYDDQRNPARDRAVPYIRSAIATGPYLRLVVPYQPQRDTRASTAACPAAGARRGDARAEARLVCLQRSYGVLLDDVPLTTLQYELGSDDRTDRPALVAMIDIRALAAGRHELRVMRPPRHPDTARNRGPAADSDRIPFWR